MTLKLDNDMYDPIDSRMPWDEQVFAFYKDNPEARFMASRLMNRLVVQAKATLIKDPESMTAAARYEMIQMIVGHEAARVVELHAPLASCKFRLAAYYHWLKIGRQR